MEEWKEYKLGEITNMKNGKKRPQNNGVFPVYGGNGIMDYSDSYNAENAIIVGRVGAYCGCVYKCESKCWVSDNAISIFAKDIADTQFLYYLMTTLDFHHHHIGGAQPLMTQDIIGDFTVSIPPLSIQHQIIQVLKSLDDKIEVNKRINDNLERQAQALFKSWFVDFEPFKEGMFVDSELGMIPESWRVCSAETIFKINIGKTPPRKEQQWFSNINNGNVKWISISDLGSNEIFIEDSKEYLTKEAISKFNIIVVPEDTILVSFKLTVGRVGISNCELTTNEAVARFYLPKSYFREYTYLSLKKYNYARLGSTSSIATAVNSKIIKNMKLLIPPVTIISEFSKRINPLFNAIRIYENEIRNLSKIRNTLLPKLMSGELKINDINN